MENLTKLLVRLSIIGICIYFIICASFAVLYNEDIFNSNYIVILELCLCLFVSAQGKYHCKYIKYLAWSIFLGDFVTRLDNHYDFLSPSLHNYIPIFLVISSAFIILIKAIRHFYQVTKRRNKRG
jgi:hypothetical protein